MRIAAVPHSLAYECFLLIMYFVSGHTWVIPTSAAFDQPFFSLTPSSHHKTYIADSWLEGICPTVVGTLLLDPGNESLTVRLLIDGEERVEFSNVGLVAIRVDSGEAFSSSRTLG